MKGPPLKKKASVVDNIKKLEEKREERRRQFEEKKQQKLDRIAQNEAAGKVVDAEFDLLIEKHRQQQQPALNVSRDNESAARELAPDEHLRLRPEEAIV